MQWVPPMPILSWYRDNNHSEFLELSLLYVLGIVSSIITSSVILAHCICIQMASDEKFLAQRAHGLYSSQILCVYEWVISRYKQITKTDIRLMHEDMDTIFVYNTTVTLSCSHWLLGGSSCFYEQTRHQDTYSQHRCSPHSLLLPHSHINPVGKRQIVMITMCPVSAWHYLFSCFAPQCSYSLGCNNDLDHIHMAFLSHWSSANQIEVLFCIHRPGHHICMCP